MSIKNYGEELVLNKIALIALFASLSKFLEKEDYESVKEIVEEVLREARKEK